MTDDAGGEESAHSEAWEEAAVEATPNAAANQPGPSLSHAPPPSFEIAAAAGVSQAWPVVGWTGSGASCGREEARSIAASSSEGSPDTEDPFHSDWPFW